MKCRLLKYILTLILLIGFRPVEGQKARLEGAILDTLNHLPVHSVISLLQIPDSALLNSTITDENGKFIFEHLPSRIYLLHITSIGYLNTWKTISLDNNMRFNLGIIYMNLKSDTLTPVTIRPKNPSIRMKGDTLEFGTFGIHLKEQASVEDLLKHLPGFKIDLQGVITVNGKKIDKILVDGEDIFGANPSLVTRNITGEMVDKIQIINKRSAISSFTGIEDGQSNEVINLTIRDDKKQGYFGKTEIGDGSQGYHNYNGMLGSFKNKKQFAAIGKASNNGITTFNGVGDQGLGFDLSSDEGDQLAASAGPGIPNVVGSTIHYSDLLNGGQDHLSANYQVGRLTTQPSSSSITKQLLPDSIYLQNQQYTSSNHLEKQTLDLNYNLTMDSVSALQFSFNGIILTGQNRYRSSSTSFFNDTLVNKSLDSISSNVSNKEFRSNLMWQIRGKTIKDRSFSVITGLYGQNYKTDGYLHSTNIFYRATGDVSGIDSSDQRKSFENPSFVSLIGVDYSEPVWKKTIFSISYNLTLTKNKLFSDTYNKENGKYDEYVDSLSNHFASKLTTQQYTLTIQSKKNSVSYFIGANFYSHLYQISNITNDTFYRYHYSYLTPVSHLDYIISKNKTASFNYYASSILPNISQLQPVQNNNDPLHIFLGNIHLQPSFSHDFRVGFQTVGAININALLNLKYTSNNITTKSYTDSLGRQVTQSVNSGDSKTAGLNIFINRNITPLNLNLGVGMGQSFDNSTSLINLLLSQNKNYSSSFDISAGMSRPDKFSFVVHLSSAYSYLTSSVNKTAIHYWTQLHSAELTLPTFLGIDVSSYCSYNSRDKVSNLGGNKSVLLWNICIIRNIGHNSLSISFQLNNVLDQNVGLSQSISSNQVSERDSNFIGRYWMISAIYRFAKKKRK